MNSINIENKQSTINTHSTKFNLCVGTFTNCVETVVESNKAAASSLLVKGTNPFPPKVLELVLEFFFKKF